MSHLAAWLCIIMLPFKFFASEVYMWNMDQLKWLVKAHQVFMVGLSAACMLVLITSMVAMQRENQTAAQRAIELSTDRFEKELDRHDARLQIVERQIVDINLQTTKLVMGLETLTSNLTRGMTILGVIATALIGQLFTYAFGFKMRRELSRVKRQQERGD